MGRPPAQAAWTNGAAGQSIATISPEALTGSIVAGCYHSCGCASTAPLSAGEQRLRPDHRAHRLLHHPHRRRTTPAASAPTAPPPAGATTAHGQSTARRHLHQPHGWRCTTPAACAPTAPPPAGETTPLASPPPRRHLHHPHRRRRPHLRPAHQRHRHLLGQQLHRPGHRPPAPSPPSPPAA